jgi:methyl-accepting chemotaxis protein
VRRFHDIRLKRKLTLIMIGVMAASFAVSALMAGAYRYRSDRRAIEHHLSVLASAIGSNCSAALVFNDEAAASEVLSALQFDRSITCALLTDERSQRVASFGTCANVDDANADANAKHGGIRIDQRIVAGGKIVGYLTLWGGTSQVAERMANEAVISITAFVVGVLVVLMVFERMLRLLNAPLVELHETIRRVVRSRNYSLRAAKVADDEIGDVVVAFNQLMEQLQAGDSQPTPTPQTTEPANPESSPERHPAALKP